MYCNPSMRPLPEIALHPSMAHFRPCIIGSAKNALISATLIPPASYLFANTSNGQSESFGKVRSLFSSLLLVLMLFLSEASTTQIRP